MVRGTTDESARTGSRTLHPLSGRSYTLIGDADEDELWLELVLTMEIEEPNCCQPSRARVARLTQMRLLCSTKLDPS